MRSAIMSFASAIGVFGLACGLVAGQKESGRVKPHDKKPVHVFILSGQSNMAGMKPELGFEPEAKKLFPDADVVYFRVARGGQPIRYWVKEWPEIAKKHGLTVPQPKKKAGGKNAAAEKSTALEFAILANTRDHGDIIKAAEDATQNVKVDGKLVARWLPVETKADGSQRDITEHGQVAFRDNEVKGKTVREFLVIVDDEKFRVTEKYLTKAYATVPEHGGHAIGFELNQQGSYLFQTLTSENRPEEDGFRRRLAIVLNSEIYSAPNLLATISGKGMISGDFTKQEANDIVAALRKGMNGNDGTKYYQPILDEYAKVLKKHPNPTSVTFCWMQGERDAREKLDAAYADALKQLISNLRRDLKQPKMNFVIGRLSDFGKPDYTSWQNVRKAQVAVAEQDPQGAWVDCDDLNNKTKGEKSWDDLHYTKEGYELLGRRYARQGKALIDGEKPAKDGRPE